MWCTAEPSGEATIYYASFLEGASVGSLHQRVQEFKLITAEKGKSLRKTTQNLSEIICKGWSPSVFTSKPA